MNSEKRQTSNVWHGLPSSKIAFGFVQAHWIAQNVIEAKAGKGSLGNTYAQFIVVVVCGMALTRLPRVYVGVAERK